MSNIGALLSLELFSGSHLTLMALFLRALHPGELILLQLSLVLFSLQPLRPLILLVLESLLLGLLFPYHEGFFLLNLFNIPLQSINPMLELLHILL